jgi:transposase
MMKHLPAVERTYKGRGRIPHEDPPIIRAFLAKSFFKIDTTVGLLQRLESDSSLRRICGFTRVPSAATFSRRLKEFSDHHIMEQTLYQMVREYHSGKLVGHISRDSTAIAAREKPVNKKRDVAVRKKPKRKRGRPRKGESRPPKEKKRLAKQLSMTSGKALRELDRLCVGLQEEQSG